MLKQAIVIILIIYLWRKFMKKFMGKTKAVNATKICHTCTYWSGRKSICLKGVNKLAPELGWCKPYVRHIGKGEGVGSLDKRPVKDIVEDKVSNINSILKKHAFLGNYITIKKDSNCIDCWKWSTSDRRCGSFSNVTHKTQAIDIISKNCARFVPSIWFADEDTTKDTITAKDFTGSKDNGSSALDNRNLPEKYKEKDSVADLLQENQDALVAYNATNHSCSYRHIGGEHSNESLGTASSKDNSRFKKIISKKESKAIQTFVV